MRTLSSYVRLILFIILAFFLFEFIVDSGDQFAFEKYPIIWAIFGGIIVFSIAVEIIAEGIKSTFFNTLSQEAKDRYVATEALQKENQFSGIKQTYKNLLGSKPIQEEHEIILDHNYDGIKELDNNLPPWWVYSFYASIIFAVIYMVRYHVFDDINQIEEYEIAVADAQLEIEAYKKTAKNLVDVNTVTLLTEASDLNAGKAIFETNCIACHKADGGGGIGPNLTDTNWILGGGIKDIFHTISEGGRDGKGMVAWKSELKPVEIAQVSSYVLQFQGTTPAEPKAPEGDVWINPDAPQTEAIITTDSISSTN